MLCARAIETKNKTTSQGAWGGGLKWIPHEAQGSPQARTFEAGSPQQRPPKWPIRPRCRGPSLAAWGCSSPD